MKRIFKRNQLIITSLAALIAVAGYLNYTEKNDKARKDKMEAVKTEVVAVGNEENSSAPAVEGGSKTGDATEKDSLSQDANQANSDDIESNDQDVQSTPGEAIFVNATGTVDFIPLEAPDETETGKSCQICKVSK